MVNVNVGASCGKHGFTTPLRYPGGKGMLANFVKLMLVANDLLDGHYIEVYAGGAAVAWPLLFDEYVRHVHINDLDEAVMAFWHSALHETDALCGMIRDTPVTIEQWHRQRVIQNHRTDHSRLELGFSTFFLNRTNRSGIIRGGVIGGKEQAGQWKLDARYRKDDLISRVERIARYAHRVTLYCQDAAHFIETVLPTLPGKALAYLDPPYYVKGEGLYEHHYTHVDHVRIADLVLSRLQQPWIVSYDAARAIVHLYRDCQRLKYSVNYSVQDRYAGREVMFFSRTTRVPLVNNPIRVDRGRVQLSQF
ncbi:MAG: DNA adenine methylase [Anaerolineales bacterium]|nr:DNA adenine methylase [Anaerolineales bacterium]